MDKFVLDGFLDELVQGHAAARGGNRRLAVKFGRNPQIEFSGIGFFGFTPSALIYSIMALPPRFPEIAGRWKGDCRKMNEGGFEQLFGFHIL